MRVGWVGHDVVQISRDRAHVLGDRPLVIVQHDDETLRLRLDVIERLVADAAGECGVAGHDHDVLIPACQIAPDRHPEAGGERGPGVARAIDVMFAFGAKEKPVEPFVLSHGVDAIEPAGKHLVDVTLVADVEDKLVVRGGEDAVERDRQLDHAEVRTEMAAGFRKHLDQGVAHFLRELRQAFLRQCLDVGGGSDPVEQAGGFQRGRLRRD